MPTPEIINYVRQQIASGIPRDQISASLKQNGWNDLDIAEAFKASAISANTAEKSSLKYRKWQGLPCVTRALPWQQAYALT